MALKIITKKEQAQPKLPEGADRFVWTELPPVVKPPTFTQILKHEPKKAT